MRPRLALPICLAVVIPVVAPAAVGQVAARAFEPYEVVRAALAADRLDGVAAQAAVLAPLADELAGAEAKAAAERLARAADLKAARDAFGALSRLLVPKFRAAKLTGVLAFECSMVKLPWAQRGEAVQNPYMGKAMLTCGIPLKDKQ